MSPQNATRQTQSTQTSIAPWRIFALWGGLSLGWEIFLALMIKLALVIGIKMAFFSDPLPKLDVANEVANVFQNAPVVDHASTTQGVQTIKESK